MEDSPNDRDMYHEIHGQWSINQNDNACINPNRNQQVCADGEAFHPPPDHLMQERYSHQDVFSSNVFPNNNSEKPAESSVNVENCHGNYNENAYLNLNPNIDISGMQNQQGFACLDLGNGQILKTKIIYNEKNQPQYMVPLNNYELFNPNMRHNVPLQPHCLPMMMNYMPPMNHMPPENSALHLEPSSYGHMPSVEIQPQQFNDLNRNHQSLQENNNMESPILTNLPTYEQPTVGKKHLIDNFLGNWNNNPSGTYTPFGHTFLNVQPNINYQRDPSLVNLNVEPAQRGQNISQSNIESEKIKPVEQFNRKEQDCIFSVEATGKKRIVAEVKPMRPSYSAVVSKTPKGQNITENTKKKSNGKEQNKFNNMKQGSGKLDKTKSFMGSSDKPMQGEEKGKKHDAGRKNLFHAQVSSGSDSGENSGEFPKKNSNSGKQYKYKNENVRKWVSLDDLSNDTDSAPSQEVPNYTNCDSEFVFVPQPEEKTNTKKRTTKKSEPAKKSDRQETNSSTYMNGAEEIVSQEPTNDTDKTRRKNKDGKSNYNSKSAKSGSDRNKRGTQPKQKKGRGAGYLGILQAHAENWLAILLSVMVWFYNLLVDIFQMSAHLSVDLLSTLCTKSYKWSQGLWIFIKELATNTQWVCNFGTYIDKKFGNTRIGFWRKLKWFKTMTKPENETEKTKRNVTNIPLPATGDDAMKRLLACKGKDPYSILGVAVQCSDDDIKHYYRRQAFLVHPDKNQQPGAEEAFKILQHAFDLIGEPERREAYDRKLLESRHMEAAWSELSELLAQLHDKVRHAAGTIRCTNCTRRHKRTLTTRPCYAARYCAQCKINHSAKEGDIWAESGFWGLVWMYYACMDGAVYQITEWAACQKKNLNHLKANTHHVRYRIVLGNKLQPSGSGKQNTSSAPHDANLEDFLNNLYTKAKTNGGQPSSAGASARTPTSAPQTSETSKNKRKYKKNIKT